MRSSKGQKGPGLSLLSNKSTATKIKREGIQEKQVSVLNHLYSGNPVYPESHPKPKLMCEVQMEMEDEEREFEEHAFPDPKIPYKIMPAEEDRMALDVTTLDIPEQDLVRNNVIVWDYHAGPNQHFYFKRIEGNKFFIINSATGFTLQVPNESSNNQIQIHVNPKNQTIGEMWQLVSCGEGLYKFKSFCGKLLDVKSAWVRNGSPVIQYEDNGGKNQKWKIIAA